MKDLLEQILYLVSSANDSLNHEMTDETFCSVEDKLSQASKLVQQLKNEVAD
jgi:hypothetical protein